MTGNEDINQAMEYFTALFMGDFYKSLWYSVLLVDVARYGLEYEVIYLAYEKHKATDSASIWLAFDMLKEQAAEWLK